MHAFWEHSVVEIKVVADTLIKEIDPSSWLPGRQRFNYFSAHLRKGKVCWLG